MVASEGQLEAQRHLEKFILRPRAARESFSWMIIDCSLAAESARRRRSSAKTRQLRSMIPSRGKPAPV
eukprot:2306672-Heterocapsa_arctica.AAC.1